MFTIGVVLFLVLMVKYPEYIYEAGFGVLMMLLFLPTLIHFFFMHLRYLKQRDQPVRYVHRDFPNVVYTNEQMPDYLRSPPQKVTFPAEKY
uniref:AA_permease domain-containing protein n=1 Tax=Steinernema glaseri TaxID=37863 RepID=A0A1I7ZJU3_9BILA